MPSDSGLLAQEPLIRLSFFAAVFMVMVVWEALAPRRAQAISRWQRWPNNLAIVVVNTAVLRVIFPTATIGIASLAAERGWGLLKVLDTPTWVALPLSVILLDLAIYGQHIAFHAAPPLWRLHRMHHADLDFDVTTGLRFHPIEIILSMVIKLAVVVVLGAPVLGVLIFEVLLNATSMFSHGNTRLPAVIDRMLRWAVVTPEMHRVHHSIVCRETDSNYGFNLSWWDRLFGTYCPAPTAGHEGMTIGIDSFRDPAELRLDRMLLQPFRNDHTAAIAPETTTL